MIYILLFIVAFLYASVGHGGASGYLALMALFGVSAAVMKPTALILNLFVSLSSFIFFYQQGYFKWKYFWPLVLTSVPLAYLGGTITLNEAIYKKILGVLLLFPVIRMMFLRFDDNLSLQTPKTGILLVLGGVIGLLSGMIGIGGGILLSPVFLLMRWADQKQTAAISAIFIFVNSTSGLIGQLMGKGISVSADMGYYVAIAFVGGLLGSWMGSKYFKQDLMKYLLSAGLLIASIKLLTT